jgi:hypothetical protein
MKTQTDVLIAAMRILARDVESGDGVANAAIAEAADRLKELDAKLKQTHDDYQLIRSKAIDVLEWYYRVGDVGGAVDPMDELLKVVGVTKEWLCRK